MLPGLAAPKTRTEHDMEAAQFVEEALDVSRCYIKLGNGIYVSYGATRWQHPLFSSRWLGLQEESTYQKVEFQYLSGAVRLMSRSN
jgi:hypothetical protein